MSRSYKDFSEKIFLREYTNKSFSSSSHWKTFFPAPCALTFSLQFLYLASCSVKQTSVRKSLAIVSNVKGVKVAKNDGHVVGARYGSGLRVSAGSSRSYSLGMILGNRDVPFRGSTRYCSSCRRRFIPFFIPRPWLGPRVFNFSPLSPLERRKHPFDVKTKSFGARLSLVIQSLPRLPFV